MVHQAVGAETIDVGLIGYGVAGRFFHAPVISATPGLRLAAVLQRSGSDVLERFPDARVVRSLEALLVLPNIRLIVIATPNLTHVDLARRCLLAGKDVVIDKPFATNVKEGVALAQLAQQQRRLLTIYQNRRWDGDFRTVRALIERGTLGRLVRFESRFDRYRPELRPGSWREKADPGAGVLFDLGVHLIDQAMQLFGPPEAIIADIRCERNNAIADDAFDMILHYPGMRAVLGATMLASAPGPRFVLHGTTASYVKYGLDPQEQALKGGAIPAGSAWGQEDQSMWGTLTPHGDQSMARPLATETGSYRLFYENIRDAIHGRASLAATAQQALDVLRVIELARESSDCRSVVPWQPV
jgi:scyllo-inositol 2-dehydrogenase (NADP+)